MSAICTVPECGEQLQDFFHLLAASMVVGDDGCVRLRVSVTVEDCTDVEQYIDCTNAHLNPLELLKHTFGIDDCGRVVLNLSAPYEVDFDRPQ